MARRQIPIPAQMEIPSRELPVVSVTVEEAVEMTRIGRNAMLEFIASGKLRTLKVGKKNIITVKELNRFLDESLT